MVATQILPDADGYAYSPCECPRDERGLRYSGYLRLPGRHRLACDQPVLLRVPCGHHWIKPCGRSDESKCRPCAIKSRRLLARKVLTGLEDAPAGWYAYLFTINAPGTSQHQRWDPNWLRGSRPPCECHVDNTGNPIDLATWNPAAGAHWNHLITSLHRQVDMRIKFHRVAEVQSRGAIHLHNVILSPLPLNPLHLQDLAQVAGFGCVMDLSQVPNADYRKIANYIAKYVSKGSDRKNAKWAVEMCDTETGEIWRKNAHPNFRAHSSSRDWGITLREIRALLRSGAERRAAALQLVPVAQVLIDVTVGPHLLDPAGVGPPG